MKECLIYGILGGFIGSLYMGWLLSSKSPHSKDSSLAVVDMQSLVSRKSQQLATTMLSDHPSSNQPSFINSISIRETATQLKDDLERFATTHNLILINKLAVVSGNVPDKTEEISDLMERGINHP